MFSNNIIKFIYKSYPLTRGKRFLLPLYKYISGYEIIKDSNQNMMLLNLDNYIDAIIYFNGNYEQTHIEFLYSQFIKLECNYFLDIGANIGIYSIYFANNANLKMCYSFEPDPRNYAQLNANIFLNNQSRKVKLVNCALSDKSSKGELFIANEKKDIDLGKCNVGTHSLEKNSNRHNDKVEIDIFRGDDLIKLKNKNICLKIDVEGHELNALKGLINILSNNNCLIMIEIFDDKYDLTNDFLVKNKFKNIESTSNLGLNYFYKNF